MRNNHTRKSESFKKFSAIFKVALIFLNYFVCRVRAVAKSGIKKAGAKQATSIPKVTES
jgi:hypothetical protein